jgi:hypothetical protein
MFFKFLFVLGIVYVIVAGIKRGADVVLRFILGGFVGFELSITAFADADGWRGSLYESEFALLHNCSLAQSGTDGVNALEIKRHHYRDPLCVDLLLAAT